jgi:peptide-methionine (S)-S-oxide reductase
MALDFPEPDADAVAKPGESQAVAVFAGGCFWCTEAVYRELDGVTDVKAGYAGGTKETADYKMVCSGRTGHAEAIEITYDPRRTSFGELMKIFFSVAHDPTQLNRQGNDIGPQYRSAIFYADDAQKKAAQAYIEKINKAKYFDSPIVTTLEPLEKFYVAEDYHQDYARLNPTQPYIAHVSMPKVAKFRQYYGDRRKKA